MWNPEARQRWLRVQWYALGFLKRAVFAFIGVAFVFAAAIIISIIQFQLRIIEAKNQSKNFSLTSLTQSVVMQKEFVESVKTVQKNELILARYQDFQGTFYSEIAQFVSLICFATDDAKRQDCVLGSSNALLLGDTSPVDVNTVVAKYTGVEAAKFGDDLKAVVGAAINLTSQRS